MCSLYSGKLSYFDDPTLSIHPINQHPNSRSMPHTSRRFCQKNLSACIVTHFSAFPPSPGCVLLYDEHILSNCVRSVLYRRQRRSKVEINATDSRKAYPSLYSYRIIYPLCMSQAVLYGLSGRGEAFCVHDNSHKALLSQLFFLFIPIYKYRFFTITNVSY